MLKGFMKKRFSTDLLRKTISIALIMSLNLLCFVGCDDDAIDNINNDPPSSSTTSLDDITGLNFYNIEEIPFLETDEEFREEFIPYILRGICEKYAEAQLYSEYILSKSYMNTHTYDEWIESMEILAAKFEIVEMYAEVFRLQLEHSLSIPSKSQKTLSNPFIITAYAYDRDEVLHLQDEAIAKGLNIVKHVAKNLGVSAEKAKRIAKECNYTQTSIATAEMYNNELEREELGKRIGKGFELAGKGASIVITVKLWGAGVIAGAIAKTCAVVSGVDTILSATEDSCFVALGSDSKNSSFLAPIESFRKYTSKIAGLASIVALDIKGSIGKLDVSSWIKTYEVVSNINWGFSSMSDALDGKMIGIDFKNTGEVVANYLDNPEESKEYLANKKINTTGYSMSDEEYQQHKKDGTWIDLPEDKWNAYFNKRNDDIAKKQGELSGKIDKLFEDWWVENTQGKSIGGNNTDNIPSTLNAEEITSRQKTVDGLIKEIDAAFDKDTKFYYKGNEYGNGTAEYLQLILEDIVEREQTAKNNLNNLLDYTEQEMKGFSGSFSSKSGLEGYQEELHIYNRLVNEYFPAVNSFAKKYAEGFNSRDTQHVSDMEAVRAIADELGYYQNKVSGLASELGTVYTYNNLKKVIPIAKNLLQKSIKHNITQKEYTDYVQICENSFTAWLDTVGIIAYEGYSVMGYLCSVIQE